MTYKKQGKIRINEDKWIARPSTFTLRRSIVVSQNMKVKYLKNSDGLWDVKKNFQLANDNDIL